MSSLTDTSRVARRPDLGRILTARRMAIRNTLTDQGMRRELADTWCHGTCTQASSA